MSTFDDLVIMRETAWGCDARTRSAIQYVQSQCRQFSKDSRAAQQQASTILSRSEELFGQVEKVVWEWNTLECVPEGIERIKAAVSSRTQPVYVVGVSCTTAHEAAFMYARAALAAWDSTEGDDDQQKCNDLCSRLQNVQCPDMYSQIEWECSNALAEMLPADNKGVEAEPTPTPRSKTKGGANKKWEALYRLICSDEMNGKSDEEIAKTYRQRFSSRPESAKVNAKKVKDVRYDYGKRKRK